MSALLDFAGDALWAVLRISLPILLAAMLAGIAVAIVQTLFQVQDQSLPFAVKLATVAIALRVTAPAIGGEIRQLLAAVARLLAAP